MTYCETPGVTIAVCDDEKVEIEYLERICAQWAKSRHIALNVLSFHNAESFLFYYDGNKSFDLLLLDIQMEGMDGVELARTIRKDNQTVQIVFITGYPDHMAEGYEVDALHYLMKPVNEDKLFKVLDRAVRNLNRAERSVVLSCEGQAVRIPAGEIIYAEIFSHTAVIATAKGNYETRIPIKELEARLGNGFIRCHRSFIAGLKYMRRITKTDVILDSGKTLPLSRRCYDEVNKAFIRYYSISVSDGKEGE